MLKYRKNSIHFMKKYIQKYYDLLIMILAIISVSFAIADMSLSLPFWVIIIDNIIYGIFIFDYCIRFILSKDKKNFFRLNILDLIAILPFNTMLRGLRILKLGKLTRLTKLTKLTRFIARGSRSLIKSKKFFNTNGFKYVCMTAIIAIIFSSIAISYIEKMDFIDAVWWSFVTATTVGYGDISPTSNIGRIIAALLMLIGIGLIGSLTSTITSFFMAEKKKNLDSSKVEMCLVLYEQLNDDEKELFFNNIDKN